MTFQYASDLHLEFPENYDFLCKYPIEAKAEILLLAGDIVTFSQLNKRMDFFDYLSDNFAQVYWIPGNHEYYYSNIERCRGEHDEQIKSNVHLVNNRSIILEDCELICSTMWSHISPQNAKSVARCMSDFHLIRNHDKFLSTQDVNNLHKESLNYITQSLMRDNQKQKIVLTHHVPTFLNYPERFLGSILNQAFATELSEMIEAYKPSYWIYGHHHQNTQDFKIGQTTMLTNQLGYVRAGEHCGFSQRKLLEM